MDMKSMKMSPAEVKEYTEPSVALGSAPRYPYGLCINLDDDGIEKLGLVALPEVGSTLMIQARVQVVAVRQNQRQDELDRNVELQITDMAIGPDTSKPSVEQQLYNES